MLFRSDVAESLRILLADDHAVLRAGMRRLLELDAMVIVAEADSGERAYPLYLEHLPDVVVLDLGMPGAGGLETLRRIVMRDADARVLVYSMHDRAGFAVQALRAGARGYVTKACPPEELVAAVRVVARGGMHLSADLAQRLALKAVHEAQDPADVLSPREFEIFRLLADGLELDDIARRLNLSAKTVANHQSLLKHKLGISTATELVRLALRHGVIDR